MENISQRSKSLSAWKWYARGLDAEFKSRDFLMISSAPINWCVHNFLNILHPLSLVDFGWQLTFSKEDFEMSCLIRSLRVIWTLQARTQTFDRQVMRRKIAWNSKFFPFLWNQEVSVRECKRISSTWSDPDIISVAPHCFSDCLLTCLLACSVDLQRICNQGLSDLLTWLPPPLLNVDWQTTSLILRCCKEYQRNEYICMVVVNNLNIIRHTLFLSSVLADIQLHCFSDVAKKIEQRNIWTLCSTSWEGW